MLAACYLSSHAFCSCRFAFNTVVWNDRQKEGDFEVEDLFLTVFSATKTQRLGSGEELKNCGRARYASIDVNDDCVYALELAVLNFWCVLYHFGISSFAVQISSEM